MMIYWKNLPSWAKAVIVGLILVFPFNLIILKLIISKISEEYILIFPLEFIIAIIYGIYDLKKRERDKKIKENDKKNYILPGTIIGGAAGFIIYFFVLHKTLELMIFSTTFFALTGGLIGSWYGKKKKNW